MTGRYGPQPVKRFLNEERWTCRRASEAAGVSLQHFARAINGYHRPSPEMLAWLTKALDVGVEYLFTPEVLLTPHCSKRDKHLVGAK